MVTNDVLVSLGLGSRPELVVTEVEEPATIPEESIPKFPSLASVMVLVNVRHSNYLPVPSPIFRKGISIFIIKI